MAKRVSVIVHGKWSTWSVDCMMKQGQIDAMRNDGIEVDEIINTVPMWVAEMGLVRPWCFAQDVFNFRNPFAK